MNTRARREEQRRKGKIQQQIAIALTCITVVVAMLTTLYSGKGSILGLYDPASLYHVGELADEDFYATKGFEFVDVAEAERMAAEGERAVLPIFTYQIRATVQSKRMVEEFITSYGNGTIASFLVDQEKTDSLHLVRQISMLDADDRLLLFSLLRESADHVLENGLFSADQVEAVVGDGYGQISYLDPETGTVERSVKALMTKENLAIQLVPWFSAYGEAIEARVPSSLVIDVLAFLLTENVAYDRVQTMNLRAEARESVVEPTMKVEREPGSSARTRW